MATPKETVWECAPHTLAKHAILRRYLQAWFPILDRYHGRIIYIDGFAGPGRYIGGEPGSPVVALEVAANHSAKLSSQISFLFVENDKKRSEHLRGIVDDFKKPANFTVSVNQGEFSTVLNSSLERISQGNLKNAPIFAFVDPFGFSGVPYNSLAQLLSLPRTEVFVLFARDSVNRFLENANVEVHMQELFGMEKIDIPKGPQRINELKKLYQERLNQAATYVGSFSMVNEQGRPVYDLFFASNNQLGYVKMKEAMWAVDADGGFRFSDRDNQSQISLMEAMAYSPLIDLLKSNFSGQVNVPILTIKDYVEQSTVFLTKHMNAALKQMEKTGDITVNPIKEDGKPRRVNTFAEGTRINFIK